MTTSEERTGSNDAMRVVTWASTELGGRIIRVQA